MDEKIAHRLRSVPKSADCIDGRQSSKNPVSHARTKHIDIKFHYVREAVKEGIISLTYCPTEKMVADLLTKPLNRIRFKSLRDEMGMSQE